MGRTNIHGARALFNRSGEAFNDIAWIAHADKLVFIISTPLTQVDIDRHADLLRANILGSWVRKCKGSSVEFDYSEPDLELRVPKVIVSSGMQAPWRETARYPPIPKFDEQPHEDVGPKEEELVYILITQGRSGDVLGKIVIEPNLERAAASVMHEALNGYSTVLMAAMLKANVGKLKDDSYLFKAVDDRRALNAVDQDPKTKSIGFWC
jgi:hypothetical protein